MENRPDEKQEMKETLRQVYGILTEKGYNPIGQIVGYLLSEDPTYITNCSGVDRDELMGELVRTYLGLEG